MLFLLLNNRFGIANLKIILLIKLHHPILSPANAFLQDIPKENHYIIMVFFRNHLFLNI